MLSLSQKPNIKLFYFNDLPNFGDKLGHDLIKKLTNQEVIHANALNCNIVSIGSLLENFFVYKDNYSKRIKGLLKPTVKVWESGFINTPTVNKNYLQRKLDVFAVRGELSLSRLESAKGVCNIRPNVVLGDPGLLSDHFINKETIKKKYKVGIIPHYVDKNSNFLSNLEENFKIIDITKNTKEFLEEVASCESILSSSLHGLIAADSLSIPNLRIRLSSKIVGNDYKFIDYYSSLKIIKHRYITIENNFNWENSYNIIMDNYLVRDEEVLNIKKKLLESFKNLS